MRVICKLFLILILLSTAFSVVAATPSGAVMKSKEVHYDAKKEVITASGSVFVEMDNYTLNADTIHYDLKKDTIFAEGNVRIIDPNGRIIKGERAVFKDKLKTNSQSCRLFNLKFQFLIILPSKRDKSNMERSRGKDLILCAFE